MSYRRASGFVDTIKVNADTTAIEQGELVKKDGTDNQVIAWTTGAAVLGIAKQASASGSTSPIEVDLLHPGDALIGDVDSGTPASGDFKSCDGDKNGLTVGTDSNHDFLYKYNGSTTTALVWPKKLEITTAA